MHAANGSIYYLSYHWWQPWSRCCNCAAVAVCSTSYYKSTAKLDAQQTADWADNWCTGIGQEFIRKENKSTTCLKIERLDMNASIAKGPLPIPSKSTTASGINLSSSWSGRMKLPFPISSSLSLHLKRLFCHVYHARQPSIHKVTMFSTFSPDSICDLIVNILNLLVNILLLWQSQKLVVIVVSWEGSSEICSSQIR